MENKKTDIFEDENYLQGLDPLTLKKTEQEIKKSRRHKVFTKNSVTKMVIWLLAIVIIFGASAYPVYKYIYQPFSAKNLYNSLKYYYGNKGESVLPEGMQEKFGRLYEMNPDIHGWITVENLSFPVVFSTDKEMNYYDRHIFDLSKNPVGTPVYDDNYKPDGLNKNTVIHMQPFFGENFQSYSTDINFYKKNPLIALDEIKQDKVYKIFAVAVMREGFTKEFTPNNFDNGKVFGAYLDKIISKSVLTTEVSVSSYDNILTIIAESGGVNSCLIFARELRENESPLVDVSGAKLVNEGVAVSGTDATYTDAITKTDVAESGVETSDTETSVDETSTDDEPTSQEDDQDDDTTDYEEEDYTEEY